jgi:hypothetical protein
LSKREIFDAATRDAADLFPLFGKGAREILHAKFSAASQAKLADPINPLGRL